MFVMNGKKFPSMLAIARELGKKRIYRKDFERYCIVEVEDEKAADELIASQVTEVEDSKIEVETPEVTNDVEASENQPEEIEEIVENNDNQEEEVEMENAEAKGEENVEAPAEALKEEKKAKRKERKETKQITPEMLARAEELRKKAGYSDDIWEWAVDMKQKTAEEVFALAESLGLTWERHEVQRIDRMRAVMTLRENLFPGQKRPRVRRSPWRGIPNEAIAEIAKKHGVEYQPSVDKRITRMRLIKALKDAGINSPE